MNKTASKTTGPARQDATPEKSTGLLLGETGVAKPSQTEKGRATTQTEAIEAKERLTQLSKRAFAGDLAFDLKQAETDIWTLGGKCDWTQATIPLVDLIDRYAKQDTTHAILTYRFNEFMASLDDFPTWAVIRAIREWRSDQNEFRFRAPLEGDLISACKLNTATQRVAAKHIAKAKQDQKK